MVINEVILLPSPLLVVKTLFSLASKPSFWQATGVSILRVVAGFAAAAAVGTIWAVLGFVSPLFNRLFSPLLKTIRAVPVASFIILALVAIRTDLVPVFTAFLMVVPIFAENVGQGLADGDRSLLEMARVFKMPKHKVLFKIRIPAIVPYFLAAIVNGLGFAWKSAVAAEVICRPVMSIGRGLSDAKTYLETPEVFAWTVTVVILSIGLEKIALKLTARGGKK
jgi:NitT/TauT family transport system permease protein